MYDPITVCVPVYNEAKTISQTIDSIFAQDFTGEMDVSVCHNGCTDNTAEVLAGLSRKYPLRIISTNIKGKQNAWNLLRTNAKHDRIVFTDGDVFIDKSAFRYLYEKMEDNRELIVVGGGIVPATKGCDWLTRFIHTPHKRNNAIDGKLYMMINSLLQQRFDHYGITEMPCGVIDDSFVTALAGKGRYDFENRAKVYYTPHTLREWIAIERRGIRGRKYFKENYGQLFADNEDNIDPNCAEWLRRKIPVLLELGSPWMIARGIAYFLTRRAIHCYARRLVEREGPGYHTTWETSSSSKRPVIL